MIELCYTPHTKFIKLTANAVELHPDRVKAHLRAMTAALAWLEAEEKLNAEQERKTKEVHVSGGP